MFLAVLLARRTGLAGVLLGLAVVVKLYPLLLLIPLALLGLMVTLILSIGHIAIFRPQVIGEFFFACVLLAVSRQVPSKRSMVANEFTGRRVSFVFWCVGYPRKIVATSA